MERKRNKEGDTACVLRASNAWSEWPQDRHRSINSYIDSFNNSPSQVHWWQENRGDWIKREVGGGGG